MTEQMRREALMAHSKEELIDLLLDFYHQDGYIKYRLKYFMNEWEIDKQRRIEKARKRQNEITIITPSMTDEQIELALADKAATPIFDMPLTIRSSNCLRMAGYTQLIDVILLVYERPDEFRSIKNLKEKQAVDILGWLYYCGVEIPSCYDDLFEVGEGSCQNDDE